MNLRWTLLTPILLSGCILGDAWPDLYAEAYCASAFKCVDPADLEAAGFEDEATCRDVTRAVVEADPKYLGYVNGDCKWNAENAKSCIDELGEAQSADTCDGAATLAQFTLDALTPACALVYDECL